ncbi:MAG: glycosyltransferase family 2 protein [Chitinispirillales bacterium]|jgi:glycosyltransferase involved in cell wall biosynthesis|nr:glycosyltransferase family 2 protein [Chitinispirillales bacterium]
MITQWPSDTYVLVPSYKAAVHLKPFIKTLAETVPKEFICVVDDASGDGTYEFCKESGIDCVRHSVNRGKGAALRTGFSHIIGTKGIRVDAGIINAVDANAAAPSACNWILTMDADGQHSPADIPRFLAAAKKYPSMGLCIGARAMRAGAMPPARILSNRLTSLILSALAGQRIKDSQCGYRLYSAALVKSVQIEYNRFEMESEIILKAAAKRFLIRFAHVQTLYLKDGGSHISHLSDTLRWAAAVLRVRRKLTFSNGRRGFGR